MTTTSFGPQSPNYTTTRPATNPQVSGGVDTWAKDCSSLGANDGTVLTASFFNVLIGNLRNLVRSAGVALDDSDAMVLDAVQAVAAGVIASTVPVYVGANGVSINNGTVRLSIGLGTGVLFTS